jgi:hypothetical protein
VRSTVTRIRARAVKPQRDHGTVEVNAEVKGIGGGSVSLLGSHDADFGAPVTLCDGRSAAEEHV